MPANNDPDDDVVVARRTTSVPGSTTPAPPAHTAAAPSAAEPVRGGETATFSDEVVEEMEWAAAREALAGAVGDSFDQVDDAIEDAGGHDRGVGAGLEIDGLEVTSTRSPLVDGAPADRVGGPRRGAETATFTDDARDEMGDRILRTAVGGGAREFSDEVVEEMEWAAAGEALADAVGDSFDQVDDAMEEAQAADDARTTALEWFGEQVSEGVDWAVDAAEEVAETLGNAAGSALDALDEAMTDAGEAINELSKDAWNALEEAWNSSIGPVVDQALEALEESGVLDAIDTALGPLVDLSYEDGNLHVGVGVEGVGSLSIEMGADGIYSEAEGFGSHVGSGWGSDGALDTSLSIGVGVARGGGTLGVDGDGDVSISSDGEVHIPVPTGGTVDVEAGFSFEQDGEGYATGTEYTVGYTTAGGQYVGGGGHASTTDDGHGNHETVIGQHQVAGQRGVVEVRTEENVTVHSHDGEITGTEGEVVVSVDPAIGDTQEVTVELWDTEHDGKGDDAGDGRRGRRAERADDEDQQARSAGGNDDLDDLTAPRRATTRAGLDTGAPVATIDSPRDTAGGLATGDRVHAAGVDEIVSPRDIPGGMTTGKAVETDDGDLPSPDPVPGPTADDSEPGGGDPGSDAPDDRLDVDLFAPRSDAPFGSGAPDLSFTEVSGLDSEVEFTPMATGPSVEFTELEDNFEGDTL